jgi:GNAT superfamily N-acetyltransferase
MNMYTRPAYRRGGIATELMARLIGCARENDCDRVSLHYHPQGRMLYLKLGFVAVETELRLNLRNAR